MQSFVGTDLDTFQNGQLFYVTKTNLYPVYLTGCAKWKEEAYRERVVGWLGPVSVKEENANANANANKKENTMQMKMQMKMQMQMQIKIKMKMQTKRMQTN